MPARSITEYVVGAPFQVGERVRVVRISDETVDARLVGKKGVVCCLEYECGCGQTFPGDPMIGVRFAGGIREEFWKEELKKES